MPLSARKRLKFDPGDRPIYAIGDVHGRLDLLQQAEAAIVEDASRMPGPKLIIMLGDYIDRGPSSAQVLAHLMTPAPQDFDRLCLLGNHELMMLEYMNGSLPFTEWLKMGSAATLASYGLDAEHLKLIFPIASKLDNFIRQSLPRQHVEFLQRMPILIDTPHTIFVHAGIDPSVPLEKQTDEDLVFIRQRFFDSPIKLPKLVVHGHTPHNEPEIARRRLNVDTRAFKSGHLTVARLWRGRVHLFST
ncbi:metallophosphoesterase [Oryzifoliimicrobium ureilyticus]|uniref:metallophosphoesterase n=1 Tax=Oryzifoliimicrobium ureilyticus TaxID=3113724 RepID=UPI0030760A7A